MDKAKLYAAAEKAFLKGQNDKAIEALEKIVRADPNDIKALNKAADIYLKLSQLNKALEFLMRVGDIYTKDGFYSKAIAIYKRILKVNEGATKADLIGIHEKLASLYGQLGLVSDAMNHFKIVVDFYDQAGDREALLEVLRKVSDLDPNNLDSQLKLAELFAHEGKAQDSVETLERLIENLEPRSHLPEIVHVFEKWVQLHPKDLKALRRLIDTYVQGGEPKKALMRLQQAFRADPYNAEILELLSSTFTSMKQPDKARAVDVELIKIYRKNGQEDKALQIEKQLKGEAPPASETKRADQQSVQKAIEADTIDPGDAVISQTELDSQEKKILSECEVYLKYGLSDKAREVLTSSIKSFPKSLALRWKLKSVCQELKLQDEVQRLIQEMSQIAQSTGQKNWLKILEEEGSGAEVASEAIELPQESAEGFGLNSFTGLDEASEISIIVEEDENLISGFEEKPAPQSSSHASQSSADVVEEIELDLIEDEVASPEEISLEQNSAEEIHEDGAEEFILSEADFSDDELKVLQSQLSPDDKSSSTDEPVLALDLEDSAITPDLLIEEPADEAPMELNAAEEEPESLEVLEASGPVGIEVSHDSGEVLGDREFELRQAVEEIEFFRSQGLDNEADELMQSLKQKYPDWDGQAPTSTPAVPATSSNLKQKEVDVDVLGATMKMKVQEDSRDEGDFFDLVGELSDEFDSSEQETPATDVPREINEVFAAFKKGVSESISADDFQTHYDLGIAYREMGLIEDAIQEFLLCSQIEGKKVSSLYQAGLCEVSRENYSQAIKYFDEALQAPKLDQQEKISVSYELADLLIRTDNRERAAELLDQIIDIDPEFRDVQEKRRLAAEA